MAKRTRVTVKWDKAVSLWSGAEFYTETEVPDTYFFFTRKEAVSGTAYAIREHRKEFPAYLYELVVKNKTNGRLSTPRTYGRDPKRSKG